MFTNMFTQSMIKRLSIKYTKHIEEVINITFGRDCINNRIVVTENNFIVYGDINRLNVLMSYINKHPYSHVQCSPNRDR